MVTGAGGGVGVVAVIVGAGGAGMRAAIEYFVKFDTGCMPDASGAFLATFLKSPVLATKAGRPEGQTKGRP